MRKLFFIIISLCMIITSTSFASNKNTEKVKSLLSKMTLEEKVGQMTQVTIQAVSKTMGTATVNHELDLKKLEEVITKYNVGSILNVWDIAHSVDYWNDVITKMQDIATKKTRLNIPVLYGIDAIHGATYTKGATLFPQALAMASSFNVDLAVQAGDVTAKEIAASGIPWNFYPVLDMGRNPVWPRLWETFGEDVFLVSEMGKFYIKGQKQTGLKSALCLKHFAGYGFPINGQDRTPAWISDRMMKEYFLPPFQTGINEGVSTIMVNSAEVDGIPTHSNKTLLTDILRNEMNFKGFVVSDWEDIKRLYTRDKVADSPKEAVRMAVMAGIDMSMVPYDLTFYELLIELVKEGSVPMSRIDEAVERILQVKMDLGLFENSYPQKEMLSQFATKEHSEINLKASEETFVLLKNENSILPLKKNTKILVTGPTSNMLSVMNGGWTITWQGDNEAAYPQENNTILEAVTNKFGKENVTFVEGTTFNKDINTAEAVKKAANSDVILLCLGEKAYCETPGNINDLTLDEAQLNLAKELSKTGKPVVLLLLEGRPRIINKIVNDNKAIVVGFLPGMRGGDAFANLLAGDVNPSGKLPVSYPKYPNKIVNYDYKAVESFDGNAYDPQFPFGFGLSYTTFETSNLTIDKNKINKNDNIKVTVSVKNTGNVKGKEVVQLYLTDMFGSVSRPNKQLKGFNKVELNPGESKVVEFTIKPEDLTFIGRENKRIVEPGEFKVSVGNDSQSFILQ